MTTILHVGPADHDGYTHFITLEPVHGTVHADNGEQGVTTVGGHPSYGPEEQKNVGDAGTTLSLCGQREFDVPGEIKGITFPDGSTWTPEKSGK